MRMIKPQAGTTTLTRLEMLLCQLYAYQKFKLLRILDKINRLDYTERTIRVYINYVRSYVTTGSKAQQVSSEFYKILDRCKAECLDILIPSEEDKSPIRRLYKNSPLRRLYKKRKSDKQVCFGVKPELDKTKINISQDTKEKLDKKTLYGIWFNDDNNIKTFKSYEQVIGYINCLKDYHIDMAFKLVQLQCEVLNDFRN